MFNTKYGSTRTKYGVFSLKYGKPHIDLNRSRKIFISVFFAFRTVLSYLLFFNLSFFFFFRAISTPKLNKVKNGYSVLFAKKLRVSVLNTKYGFCRFQY